MIALAEAVSFLILLGVAMPLKYFAEVPAAVLVVGWMHGALFIAFCAALAWVMLAARWPMGRSTLVFVAAFVPFAPFALDRRMRRYAEAFVAPGGE